MKSVFPAMHGLRSTNKVFFKEVVAYPVFLSLRYEVSDSIQLIVEYEVRDVIAFLLRETTVP